MEKAIRRYWPIFVLPTFLAFILGFIAPFAMGVYLSFCKFTTVTDAKFIGFSNYLKIFYRCFICTRPVVYSDFHSCDGCADQCACICGSTAFDKGISGDKYLPDSIFYAEPDRWYHPGLYLAASVKWCTAVYEPDTDLFLRLWLLGTGYSDVLAADRYMMIIYIAGIQNIPGI